MAASTTPPNYPKVQCKRLHIIVNPAAGQDRPFLQHMNTAFHEAGIDWDIFLTKKAGDAKRLAQEAVLRLEQSAVSIQRLAHALGFSDQAHFSNFFRRMTGEAPSAYRRSRARPSGSRAAWRSASSSAAADSTWAEARTARAANRVR